MPLIAFRSLCRGEAEWRLYRKLSRGFPASMRPRLWRLWSVMKLRMDVRKVPGEVWRSLAARLMNPLDIETVAAFVFLNNFHMQLFGALIKLKGSSEIHHHFLTLLHSWRFDSNAYELRSSVITYCLALGYYTSLNCAELEDAPSELKENEPPAPWTQFEDRNRQMLIASNRQ